MIDKISQVSLEHCLLIGGPFIMPKTYFCWRCEIPVPMLTEEEWEEVEPLLRKDIEHIKAYRTETGVELREALDTLRHEACERYFEITGFKETNPNALWHHRLSIHGSECTQCGHLFRSPEASFCANCGNKPGAMGESVV